MSRIPATASIFSAGALEDRAPEGEPEEAEER